MNVLLLMDDFNIGGVGRHVVDLAHGLKERNIRVTVAATNGDGRSWLSTNIPYVPIPLLQSRGKKTISGFVRSFMILRRTTLHSGISIVHTHKRYSDLLGRFLARSLGIVHVSTCHSLFSDFRLVSMFGDRTIACSQAVRRMLLADFNKREESVTCIYAGIRPFRAFNVRQRQAARRSLGVLAKDVLIAGIWHLHEDKDPATLIDALGILHKNGALTKVAVRILGDGPLRTFLLNKVQSNGLSDKVRFLDSSDNVELLANAADFFVLTSRREGLPYVILEAASLGKPHVATSVGGVGEFIRHGESGILTQPGDASELASAIHRLLSNPAEIRKLGKRAKETVEQQHSSKEFLKRTISVYRDAMIRPSEQRRSSPKRAL